jgi:predicted nucleic acid-binding protein
MILVDTTVWIDHLRKADGQLLKLLEIGTVLTHPLIIEEIACGYLRDRTELTTLLHSLPLPPIASHVEILAIISNKTLFGVGLGSIDVHIVASAMFAKAKIWSRDKALAREAARLGLAF